MAITALKRIQNRTGNSQVTVYNRENASTQGPGGANQWTGPGQDRAYDMWVPWCTSRKDFPQHHLAIQVTGGATTRWYFIWQANKQWKDLVRFSAYTGSPPNGGAPWADPGDPVPGLSKVSGDRTAVVTDAGIEFVQFQPNGGGQPPQQPTTGTEYVALSRYIDQASPNDPFNFRSSSIGQGRTITGVKNTAQDVNNKVAIQLNVSHGGVGPVTIQPNTTSNAFNGVPLDGQWLARAINISNVFLRDIVTLQVSWKR